MRRSYILIYIYMIKCFPSSCIVKSPLRLTKISISIGSRSIQPISCLRQLPASGAACFQLSVVTAALQDSVHSSDDAVQLEALLV